MADQKPAWHGRFAAVPFALWFRGLETVLCVALIAAFALAWRPWRGPLIFQTDSWGYLRPALRAALNKGFEGYNGRPIGYPAFLALVTHAAGLAAVPAAQACLAISAAFLALAIWRIAAAAKSAPGLAAVQAVLGIVMMAMFLSFQPLVDFAHMVMAESLGIALSLLALLLTLAACVCALGRRSFGLAFVAGWLAAALLYVVKPQWGVYWLFLWCALIAALVLRPDYSRAEKGGLAGAALLLYAALVWAPQHAFAAHDEAARRSGGLTLICNNLDIVEPGAARLETAENRAALERLRAEMRRVLQEPAGYWSTLGFYGDACVYASNAPVLLERARPANMSFDAFAERLFAAGVAQRPLTYAGRVGKQILLEIRDPFPAPFTPTAFDPSIFQGLQGYAEAKRFEVPPSMLVRSEPRPLAEAAPGVHHFATKLLRRAKEWFWPVLVLATGLTLWSLWRKQGYRDPAAIRRRAMIWGLVFGAYLASMAVIALVHTFDITRYRQADFALALLTLFVGIITAVDFFVRGRKRSVAG